MAAGKEAIDPLKFLKEFTSFLEVARRCLSILYLYHGEEKVVVGKIYVYRGLVQIGNRYLESGEYAYVNGPIRAIEESLLFLDVCTGERGEIYVDCTLSDILSRSPIVVEPSVSIKDAVRVMWENGVSSAVVIDRGKPIGILTDADVKNLVARGVDFSKTVGEVAIKPLVTAEKWESCMDALVKMSINNVKHLVVVDPAGNMIGVVSIRDIAYRLLPVPIHFLKDLKSLREIEELRMVKDELDKWARRSSLKILEPGTPSPIHMTKLITEIHDIIMLKVIENVMKKFGAPPCQFAIAVSGSQGVYEQFVVTDMDNFIITSCDDEFFVKLGGEIVEKLLKIGFPPCREGYTMDRLVLHLPRVGDFIESAGDKDVILASLIFDGRAIYGSSKLVDMAREEACRWSRYNKLRVLSSALRYKPPLGAFDRLEKRFKVKEHALGALILPIKALSMIHCVAPYSTLDRISELARLNVISPALAEELKSSYEILLRLTIWAKGQGKTEISVDEVPNISILKTAFRSIKKLHEFFERGL